MTDIPAAFRLTQLEEVDYRSGITESLLTKWGAMVNWVGLNASDKLGDIVVSVFDEATFQSLRTTDWVLMDGRSVVGSDYETQTGNSNIPDIRGKFLRCKDNGAGITDELALGASQEDENKAHQHEGVPEHFGAIAALNRTFAALPDTFNDITNNDNARAEHQGSNAGTPANLPISSVRNPVATGFGYALNPMIGSTNVPKAWCTPVARLSENATYGPVDGEDNNDFAFNFPDFPTGDTNERNDFNTNFNDSIMKGSTIPANTLVGFNARIPSDGTESRPKNIHVNYFIKINT